LALHHFIFILLLDNGAAGGKPGGANGFAGCDVFPRGGKLPIIAVFTRQDGFLPSFFISCRGPYLPLQ
jgi:hypothetical protein